MHLDYTKVIILILWWRNFQLEYWRTFQLVSTISKKQGNFLIPIGRTGYISEVLWNELLKEKQDDHTFDIYRHDIVSLGDNTKALDEVIEIVIELIKKVK